MRTANRQYAAAFATGLGFNLRDLLLVFPLVLQWRYQQRTAFAAS